MKKGIVMEINDTFLTLLTPDGQFLQAKKKDYPYTIGEEVAFLPIDQKNIVKRFLGIKQLSIAAAALLVFAGSMVPVYESNKAYAYMSIDVNPSIEIGINKQMQVVKLAAYNSDGKKIISHIGDWKKKDVTGLTQEILKEMKKEGYLTNHHSMVISTVVAEKREQKTEKQLMENVGEIKEMAKEDNLNVTVLKGTEKEMEEAHQLGVTTGKYKESKIQPAENKNNPLPAQSYGKEQNESHGKEPNGMGEQNNNSNPSVQQEERPNANPDPNPNQNNHDQSNQGNPNHNIPPGQLKKTDEMPKDQWKEIKRETKIEGKIEKNSPSLNKNQNSHYYHQKN